MAKANKRSTRSGRKPRSRSGHPSRYSSATRSRVAAAPSQQGQQASAEATPSDYMKDSSTVEWQEEYTYVFRDLRTLGVVSVVIFAAIIGAGFFF